jgi:hypothetical protein
MMETKKGKGWRTEYEDKGPCTITNKKKDDGGAAPATTKGNEELDECEDKKNGFKRNEGNSVKDQDENSKHGQEDMAIRKDEEGRRGTNHGAGGIKTYTGDNEYEGDHHSEILQEEKNDKWHGDLAIAIVERMYLGEINNR